MADMAVQVIHTLPGRLRIKIPDLKRNLKFESALKNSMQQLNGVETVRINAIARSLNRLAPQPNENFNCAGW